MGFEPTLRVGMDLAIEKTPVGKFPDLVSEAEPEAYAG